MSTVGIAVHVGIGHLTLRLHSSHSLKEKRQVVKSLTARLQNEFNVSVAEVDDNDLWQSAGIGLCCVSNDGVQVERMLDAAVRFIERTRPDLELVDYEKEVITAW